MAGEINKRLNHLVTSLDPDKVAQEGYRYFKSKTPVRSGNAKRRTRLSGDEIQANYPYAERLDNGYSDLAPEGMSAPTEKHIKSWIKRQGK